MSYQEEYDDLLNKKDSLINIRIDELSSIEDLLSGISANNITGGVFGATSDTTGIEFGSTNSLSYLQSRNFVSGSTGWRIDSSGNIEANSLTLIGGTIKYGKTSFTDSTNAGYFVSSSGFYFGSASNATYIKYTIGDGSLVMTGTMNALAGYVGSATAIIYESTGMNVGTTGHIRGGQTDYNTGTGFFLGYTGGVYKFSIGVSTGHYQTWDGTDMEIGGSLKVVERYTAGEAITAGKLICLKNTVETWGNGGDNNTATIILDDTYVDQDHADTNYDASSTMSVGTSGGMTTYSYFKLNLSEVGLEDWSEVDKVILHLYVGSNNCAGASTLQIKRVTSAWTEDTTVTYNNQPTVDTFIWASEAFTGATATGYHDFDITELFRMWSRGAADGGFANNGIRLSFSNTDGRITVYSKERDGGGGFDQEPYLTVTSNQDSDGKVYLASYSDYNKVKNVIGIAMDTVDAAASVRVQSLIDRSYYSSAHTNGRNYYLTDTAGTIGTLATTLESGYWGIKVGVGRGTKLLIERDRNPLFISKFTYNDFHDTETFTMVAPVQCTKIVVVYSFFSTVGAVTESLYGEIILYRDRITNVINDETTATNYISLTAAWDTNAPGNGNIVLTSSSTGAFTSASTATIYFYE